MNSYNNSKLNILVTMPVGFLRDSFLTPENIQLLESLGNIRLNPNTRIYTKEELTDAFSDIDVCVCGWGSHRFDKESLAKAVRLKLIVYTAGPITGIVSDELYARGIRVVCSNEVFAQSVAEGVIAYMLVAQRKFPQLVNSFATNGWPKMEQFTSESLFHQTIGIVGLGAVSRNLIKMLHPFHVQIKLYSNHTTAQEAQVLGVQKVSLKELFSSCKIVTLHCARSESNYHIVNDSLLELLPQNSLLINTARGDLIDETALIRHLKRGHFRALLDVFKVEPLPPDSPLFL